MGRHTLHGRRTLLTGASSGIGRCIAVELARCGARLVLLARRREQLEQIAGELATNFGSSGAKIEIVVGDVTDGTVRSSALALAESSFGGLDLLINNAGVSAHGRFADSSPDRLRQIMEVNFFAAAELTRESIGMLRVANDPLVVNIGSILGHRGIPHNSEYVASKFALRGLSEAMRPELAKLGIDLLLVSPGTTNTEFFDHLIDKQGELPWKSAAGVSPEAVARATIRAIERHKREIIPSWSGRALVWLNRMLPGVLDRWMRKYG